MLSIIIPAFNEEENIRKTAGVLSAILTAEKIDYELIFVDDGSADATWQEINMLSAEEESGCGGSPVKGIRFSRNFGKEGAIFAGLRRACGEAAVIIDCDLQHPPELIPDMLKLHRQGFEIVEAVKKNRGSESLFYKLFAKMFYSAMKANSDIDLDRASDFKLLDRKVIDALLEMPERLTFFRALSSWVGFSKTQIEFNVQKRAKGKSKWSFTKLVKFALSNLTGFTYFPMQFMTMAGVIFFIFALGLGINTLIQYFNGVAAEGFTTVIILVLISGSFIMFGLGIIGYYISKIYEEIKFRPRYIITKELGFKNENTN
jgi:dolichol-phosphate mannosyltransferase